MIEPNLVLRWFREKNTIILADNQKIPRRNDHEFNKFYEGLKGIYFPDIESIEEFFEEVDKYTEENELTEKEEYELLQICKSFLTTMIGKIVYSCPLCGKRKETTFPKVLIVNKGGCEECINRLKKFGQMLG